ncbi:MAG: DUF3089 domain-containing protein [Xanthomonadales bacterium]|nr:DUF3089 domain-containing protein [Xanthomonadales bacterium]
MKKRAWIIGGLIAAALLVGFIYKDLVMLMVFKTWVKPATTFAETAAPSAPDYSNPEHWAALPDREDAADFTPEGVSDGQANAAVDVFFVHPTTFLSSAGWNAPMGDLASGNWVDNAVMPAQASVFNGSARVFAPRYRQAQIYVFFALEDGGNDALELAYTDVEAAFEHYLAEYNNGRPFIVAGHSQGALHVRWLLEHKISGTQLLERMVAAYPVGYPMGISELAASIPDIPVCNSATQTSCLLTWNTIGDGYRPLLPTQGKVCVNPLTWTPEGAGTFEDNEGALSIVSNTVIPNAADGACENGMLYVSEIRTDAYDDLPNMGKGNHHLLDYGLYWLNIRKNVAERVAAFNQ